MWGCRPLEGEVLWRLRPSSRVLTPLPGWSSPGRRRSGTTWWGSPPTYYPWCPRTRRCLKLTIKVMASSLWTSVTAIENSRLISLHWRIQFVEKWHDIIFCRLKWTLSEYRGLSELMTVPNNPINCLELPWYYEFWISDKDSTKQKLDDQAIVLRCFLPISVSYFKQYCRLPPKGIS